MEIGNDDDFIDEVDDDLDVEQNDSDSNDSDEQDTPSQQEEDGEDYISSLLRDRGIEDKSRIKFEDGEGSVEEVNWDSLSNSDKLNILRSSEEAPETGLNDSEIELINSIRTSGMDPEEFIQYLGQLGAQAYAENAQEPTYDIDQYSDEELFLMDYISRMGEVNEDEATEALERAKANEALFQKEVNAIRNEYKQAENENLMQLQIEQEQAAQQEFQEFSDQIVDEINNLTEIQGFDLNMEDDDMQTLYDFITGQDAAGNNYLAKALSDPRILVKTAWLALNGDQMINDITNYFQKEITNVRKESYKKGVDDTRNKMNGNNVIFKDAKSKQEYYNDLDSF